MSTNHDYDVIVIGGGAAGMMAAGRAGARGLRVLLLEKNAVLGKKLSITGGGRCNITNAEFDTRALLKHYGDAEPFLYAPFSQFGVQDTFDFFAKHTLPLVVEERKRAFPHTHKATDVVRVLEAYVCQSGCIVMTNTPVQGFERDECGITGIITDTGTYTATSYIIASGGRSHTETGSTGEAFSWLSRIGHTAHTSNPNLVPMIVSDTWVHKLAGTVFKQANITFTQGSDKITRQGDILMTHFGLSGPTILNSAHAVKKMLEKGNVTATIDLFPQDDEGSLRKKFHTLAEEHSNKSLGNVLKVWFPKGVVEAILLGLPMSCAHEKMHSITREVRHSVVARMKSIPLTVTATKGYDWAVVSDGGVDLKEIDTRTMRSRKHPNLYIVGDMLHINRPSGGYSLQLCWTTGWVAGNSVVR